MNKPELTPWFPANVKPARDGIYQRKYSDGIFYSKWQGGLWHTGNAYRDGAKAAKYQSAVTCIPWRGLAEQPK